MRIRYLRRPPARTAGRVYLLDLDNTLHEASTHILPEINRQMTDYLARKLNLSREAASAIRTHYWQRYGATLLGMMRHHGINPHEFLAETHRFDDLKSVSRRHASVPHRLSRLNGLRVLLTNAPRAYATEVSKMLGLHRHYHALVSIEDMVIHGTWRPKPTPMLWPHLKAALKSRRLLLVDDTLGHLHEAARHGIQTSWITTPGLGFPAYKPKGRVRSRIRRFDQVKRLVF